ncbi:MAG: hypothetical protein ACC645_10915 [Pirellulales bacterium]
MTRLSGAILTAVAVISSSQMAEANWFEHMYNRVTTDWHRNNCWPDPFVQPDRMHVAATLDAITASGWRQQNLLGDHHFTSDSSTLTTAGQLKVREILTQAPQQFPTARVQRGPDRDATAARMDAVEQWASGHLSEEIVANVVESDKIVEGRPAPVVDAINVRFQETQPLPQLPKPQLIEFD